MKKMVTTMIALALLGAGVALAAGPGPFYGRGGYYDAAWSADSGNLLTLSAGVWTGAATSPMAAGYYEGKIAVADWSESYPNSNQPVFISGPGDIVHWTLDTNVYSDGWSPSTNIAYNDHMVAPGTTFEVIGSAPETGAWSTGVAATLVGDIWGVEIPIAAAGSYEVKFRKTGDWSINAGADGYGTNSGNLAYTTLVPNEPVLFQFNQVTGRVRAVVGGVTPTHSGTWGRLKSLYR
ncbi:MAG: hypothetical protein IT347_01255 [Candidatus Eisenbacteria bacterium]|nr:hypothetical protein [Candidatus Eisenbacteria bacterium]